jgi:hypothetical protein
VGSKVGAHPLWVILDSAITIELDIVRKRMKVTVNHTVVRGIRAIELVRLRGGCCAQQQSKQAKAGTDPYSAKLRPGVLQQQKAQRALQKKDGETTAGRN